MEGVPSSNDYQGGFGTGLMAKVDMMSQITLYHSTWQKKFRKASRERLFSALETKTVLMMSLVDHLVVHQDVVLSL